MEEKNRISKKKKAALIAGVLIPAFIFVFLFLFQPRPFILPPSVLRLHLTEEIRGRQAQEILDMMHKKAVTPDESVIGNYFSTDGTAKLYASRYTSRTKGEEQLKKMADLVRTDSGTFQHFREIQIQNEKVYFCLGLEQAHYFFLHENILYWWAADVQIAQSSMQELMKTIQSKKQ